MSRRTQALAGVLAAFTLSGQVLAHCGSCGVGESKEDHHAHPAKPAAAKKAHAADPGHSHGKKAHAAVAVAGPVQVGQAAPEIDLLDHNGNAVRLSDFQDKIVVIEWTNPDCPFVKRHYKEGTMKKAAAKWAEKGVVWLTVNSTHYADRAANKAFVDQYGLAQPVLSDPSGRVGRSYGARTTPHLFIRDQSGTLAYAGAIDDDAYGEKAARVNYVDAALTDLTAGRAVAFSESRPYGCSVKYP